MKLLLRPVVRTWQCFACDTWNDDATTECMVCPYDRYGFDTTQEAGR